jgi:hypothetical protein
LTICEHAASGRVEALSNGNLLLAPKERLSPHLLDEVRQHKTGLLRLLSDPYEHTKAIAHHCEATGTDLADYLAGDARLREKMARDTRPAEWTPAHSILETCQRYGVALRIEPNGTLVVGKADAKADEPSQPWPSLLDAIEAHLETVARLLATGWTLQTDFSQQAAA